MCAKCASIHIKDVLVCRSYRSACKGRQALSMDSYANTAGDAKRKTLAAHIESHGVTSRTCCLQLKHNLAHTYTHLLSHLGKDVGQLLLLCKQHVNDAAHVATNHVRGAAWHAYVSFL